MLMEFQPLTAAHDAALAALIRSNLKAHHLDIPGTVYFDAGLDHLSAFYDQPGPVYYVLLREHEVVGGVGLAPFDGFPGCCELQKLYLDDSVKGRGLGYQLIERIEQAASAFGYRQIYLETHTNLQAAIHIYEKMGYREIQRPESVVHSTMNKFYIKALPTIQSGCAVSAALDL